MLSVAILLWAIFTSLNTNDFQISSLQHLLRETSCNNREIHVSVSLNSPMPFIFRPITKRLVFVKTNTVSWAISSPALEWHQSGKDVPSYFCGTDVASELLRAGDILKSSNLSNNEMPRQMSPKFAFYNTREEDASNDVSSDVSEEITCHATKRFHPFPARPLGTRMTSSGLQSTLELLPFQSRTETKLLTG